MRIAYFDCFSGISGDMCLGALVAAGVDFRVLQEELAKLSLAGYRLCWKKVKYNGISAVDFTVELLKTEQPARCLADIEAIINDSPLPEEVKAKSKEVFLLLAFAEAAVHDTTPDSIHFHEVGAVDAIVDVVGTVLGLYLLGVEKVYASPLPLGRGFVKCEHSLLPVPAPATLEILKGVPVYGVGEQNELVTPTGAALITVLADVFSAYPSICIERVGYGAGKKIREYPNLLRLVIGEWQEPEDFESLFYPRLCGCPLGFGRSKRPRFAAGNSAHDHFRQAGAPGHSREQVHEHEPV